MTNYHSWFHSCRHHSSNSNILQHHPCLILAYASRLDYLDLDYLDLDYLDWDYLDWDYLRYEHFLEMAKNSSLLLEEVSVALEDVVLAVVECLVIL